MYKICTNCQKEPTETCYKFHSSSVESRHADNCKYNIDLTATEEDCNCGLNYIEELEEGAYTQ